VEQGESHTDKEKPGVAGTPGGENLPWGKRAGKYFGLKVWKGNGGKGRPKPRGGTLGKEKTANSRKPPSTKNTTRRKPRTGVKKRGTPTQLMKSDQKGEGEKRQKKKTPNEGETKRGSRIGGTLRLSPKKPRRGGKNFVPARGICGPRTLTGVYRSGRTTGHRGLDKRKTCRFKNRMSWVPRTGKRGGVPKRVSAAPGRLGRSEKIKKNTLSWV